VCLMPWLVMGYDRKPVADPHIMCCGIGDVTMGDSAPLQATQFEADIRIAEQLAKIWLEGGGGGNRCESYNLPWYLAAMHTTIDCFEKRGKKGYLFTVGDEEPPKVLTRDEIATVFGTKPQADIKTEDLLTMVSRNYEVFHLMVAEGSHMRNSRDTVVSKWTALLGQRAMILEDHTKMAEVIVSTIQANEGMDKDDIINSWDGSTAVVVKTAIDALDAAGGASETGVVRF